MRGQIKFHNEVFLIIIIAFASILASWGNVIGNLLGLNDNTSVLVVQILCLFILFLTSVFTIYTHRHNEKEIIRAVLESIHHIFYHKSLNKQNKNGRNPICRCTYFKYYKYSNFESCFYLFLFPALIFSICVILFERNVNLKDNHLEVIKYIGGGGILVFVLLLLFFKFSKKIYVISCMVLCIIIQCYYLLFYESLFTESGYFILSLSAVIFLFVLGIIIIYLSDSWFWHYIYRRIIVREKFGRRMKWGKSYLLSYVRFGFEGGEVKTKNTSLALEVGGTVGRLFAGRLYNSDDWCASTLNHNRINDKIKELRDEYLNISKEEELNVYKENINKNIEENIKILEEQIKNNGKGNAQEYLAGDKFADIKKFMENTNTPCWDLFSINNINHCEHFIGFKIDSNDKIRKKALGVILIDFLLQSPKDNFSSVIEKYNNYIVRMGDMPQKIEIEKRVAEFILEYGLSSPNKGIDEVDNMGLLPIYLKAYADTLTNILN